MCYLLKRLRREAETFKSKGNEQFKAGDYRESARSYTLALRTCPLTFDKDRAVMYSNRAAAKVKLVNDFFCLFMFFTQQSDNSVSC
jgi:DNA polymerase/3'-5' exonuclease PolX